MTCATRTAATGAVHGLAPIAVANSTCANHAARAAGPTLTTSTMTSGRNAIAVHAPVTVGTSPIAAGRWGAKRMTARETLSWRPSWASRNQYAAGMFRRSNFNPK